MGFEKELELARTVVQQAGQILKNAPFAGEAKEKPLGQGPVTELDLFLDNWITQRIQNQYPYDQIIGEESFREPLQIRRERVWWVDPIDGTADYVAGGPDYCVMVGFAIGDTPLLGAIYQPATDTLWWGSLEEEKAYCQKAGITQVLRLDKNTSGSLLNFTVIESKRHLSPFLETIREQIKPKIILKKGSVGLKVMCILEEEAHFYMASPKVKRWDTCAPLAIAKAAGAEVLGVDFKPLHYELSIQHQKPILVFHPIYYTYLKKQFEQVMLKHK